MARKRDHILITDQSGELPYSKGLMASSIMATGLPPGRAFAVAEQIEARLRRESIVTITAAALREMAVEVIEDAVGEHYARNFLRWSALEKIDKPLVVLVGGTAGVGKSTIATQLAIRLGINRVIPTDAIREVMRGMITRELMPSLHTSSFDTESLITQPLPKSADKVIIGYREQAQAVCVGVNSLISRAVIEGTDLIVEGAHACPGFFDEPKPDEAVFVPIVITIADEEVHRSHFAFRAVESRGRPPERYLKFFGNIRKIQKYIAKAAAKSFVPTVESFDLDETLSACIDIVLDRVADAVGELERNNRKSGTTSKSGTPSTGGKSKKIRGADKGKAHGASRSANAARHA